MPFKLALAQCGTPANDDVLAQVDAFAARAGASGARMLVFPETLMCPHRLAAEQLRDAAEPLDGPFARGVAACASRHDLWIVFTMYEADPEDGRPFNTAVVVDGTGIVRGTYRKCHLYDAHAERESDRMARGGSLCTPIVAPFCTLGLAICYDLRFPELTRAAALAGCDLVVFPAAWYDGPRKTEHWETLLRARAIENECYVAGACRAGSRFVGRSMVVGPLGEVLAKGPAGAEEALVMAEIELGRVGAARDAMPVFNHRRPELY